MLLNLYIILFFIYFIIKNLKKIIKNYFAINYIIIYNTIIIFNILIKMYNYIKFVIVKY